eukprot:15431386-Alexandrium_andersonii.AAC.1
MTNCPLSQSISAHVILGALDRGAPESPGGLRRAWEGLRTALGRSRLLQGTSSARAAPEG